MPESSSPIVRGYSLFVRAANCLQSPVLLAMRLYWGWQFHITGAGKLKNLDKTTSFFQSLHIPHPYFNACLAGGTECLCGLLLVLGLGSRLAAIPLIFTMTIAYLTAESDSLKQIFSDPDKFVSATPFLFMLTCIIVLAFGPGIFSLDWLIEKKVRHREKRDLSNYGAGILATGVALPSFRESIFGNHSTTREGLKHLPVVLFLLFAVIGWARGEETIKIGNAAIRVHASPGLPLPASNIVEWVRRSATAVSNYFGRFPVNTLYIGIESGGDERIGGGVTHGASRIDVRLGPNARARDLRRDWILTHEMFHLAFPTLKDRYLWMMEGLSDYLEPVARARAGQLSARNVWREFVEGLPQGLPAPDDDGLNFDTRRERIYWGGNLYWLLADVEIRRKTHNRRSIDDAIRAILREGGNGDAVWSIDRVIAAGDKATGTLVLKELYDELGLNRGEIHLDHLWLDLGVKYDNRAVRFDDSAPWAAIRNSITAQTLAQR